MTIDGQALEEKVGRVFWVAVHGAAGDTPHPGNRSAFGVDTPAEVIHRHGPGGVVLFGWAGNTEHPAQVAALVAELRAASHGTLGVAIDEEGGRVTRLPPPATPFPSARAVAVAADDDLAARRWRAGAVELAAVGVTTNLAPVVDLGHPTNPVLGDRTFADDPATVAKQAAIAVRGLREGGLAAVAKHFPGHGATPVDSHEALPVVSLSRTALEPHLDAFRRLLAAEPPAGIMTAHLVVEALDPAQPATRSPAVLTGLLREQLGYAGAIVTDSLSMAGVRTGDEDPEVAVAALAAGADVLLTPPDLAGAIGAVCEAVRSGRLPEQRIDESLLRAAPLAASPPVAVRSPVGPSGHLTVAAEIARRATTVVADPARRLPLSAGPLVVAGMAGSGARELTDALRRRARSTALLELADPQTARLGTPPGATLVLVRRAPELDGAAQDAALGPLARGGSPAVLVETGAAPAAHAGDLTVVLTHGASPPSVEAAADLLVGPAPATKPPRGP